MVYTTLPGLHCHASIRPSVVFSQSSLHVLNVPLLGLLHIVLHLLPSLPVQLATGWTLQRVGVQEETVLHFFHIQCCNILCKRSGPYTAEKFLGHFSSSCHQLKLTLTLCVCKNSGPVNWKFGPHNKFRDYTPTSQVQYIISQLKYSEESTTWSTTPENHLEDLTHKTGENWVGH